MRIRRPLLIAMAGLGLALFALALPSEEPRGGAPPTPAPSPAPDLKWDRWKTMRVDTPGPVAGAEENTVWTPDADPGVWATPAEFSEPD